MDLTSLNKDRTSRSQADRRKINPGPRHNGIWQSASQAKELEEAVLGAIMLEKNAFDAVVEILKPECFMLKHISGFSELCRA